MERLAKQLEGEYFDWYVAIARGGLVPTCYLAQLTGMHNVDTISVKGYDGQGEREDSGARLYAPKDYSHLAGKSILVVDDLIETGNTMRLVKEVLSTYCRGCRIKTAVLYLKTGSMVAPDYFIDTRPRDQWIIFPWEKVERFTIE